MTLRDVMDIHILF